MSFVNVEDVSKTFGDTVALDNVSLEVEQGEFVSILGPSGSGKTTLLKILAGFEEPDDGAVVVDGKSLIGVKPEDRDMSMVFQRLALFPHLSVHGNISFGLKMKQESLSKAEIDEKVEEALAMVSLEGYEDRNIQNLSGGEQQRVGLARALVMEPKLLIYDEPLSDLDRQLREQMRREIKDIHRRLGITSIYVTHNQREALTLSDRILVLHEGKRVQYDSPEKLYTEPSSPFVANFVGDSNFLEGTVTAVGDGFQFEHDGLSLPLDSDVEAGEGLLCVRPEHLHIVEGDNGRSATGELTSVVHLGSTTEYTVAIEADELLVTAMGAPEYEVGDEVSVSFEEYQIIDSNGS